MMMQFIYNYLKDPRLAGIHPDEGQRIQVHNEILSQKKMMKEIFQEFYYLLLSIADTYFCVEGEELEIGSGVSFFKKIRPTLITSDIIFAAHLDLVLDAQKMTEIKDNSLRAIYALNVFHHLSNPDKFFSELLRVLKPGGGCILIEPYYGLIAKKFYAVVHATEYFDSLQKEWSANDGHGIMSNANQALSYLVFVRDKMIFEKKYPDLNIIMNVPLHNYLRYFFSGGINFKQLLPNFSIPILKTLEFLLKPFAHYTALHHIIVIRKD